MTKAGAPATLAAAILALGGCADGLVYGERTSFNLASIRLNDDPAQPVSVELGFDRDVVLVAPPIGGVVVDDGERTPSGEAVSQFSTFTVKSTTPFLEPPTSTTELLGVQTRFASGEAALAIASEPEVVAAVLGLTSAFVRDAPGDLLRQFWKPDGKNIDPVNQKAIRDWMDSNGLRDHSITYFIRSEEDAAKREGAVRELGLE